MGTYRVFRVDNAFRFPTARFWAGVLVMLWACATPCSAVLFYSTGDGSHNTTAPTGTFENSGWQYQGTYGAFLGTIIAPQYFITARHFGLQGSTFVHNGIFTGGSNATYSIDTAANGGLGYWDIAGTDLRILKVQGFFPYYAPLYTGGAETGLTMVVHGKGGPRGDPILVSSTLHGWAHRPPDGVPRWGSNTVSGISPSGLGQMVTATFSASGTAHEATLSNGDSGGGLFVNDGGIWKLAGVNYSVDGRFDTNNTKADGSDFNAALFDRGGLYQGNDSSSWTFIPDTLWDNPSSLYASRISSNAASIISIIAVPEPQSALLVLLAGVLSLRRRRTLTRAA